MTLDRNPAVIWGDQHISAGQYDGLLEFSFGAFLRLRHHRHAEAISLAV